MILLTQYQLPLNTELYSHKLMQLLVLIREALYSGGQLQLVKGYEVSFCGIISHYRCIYIILSTKGLGITMKEDMERW